MQDHGSDGLTELEHQLWSAVMTGEIADLGGGKVRAEVVRQILTSKPHDQNAAANAVRIRRGNIEGVLDLEGCELRRPLMLSSVRLLGNRQRGAIILRDARLLRLSMQNCDLDGTLVGDRAQIENGLFVGGGNIAGAVLLRGAIIGGALGIEGGRIGDGTSAILANGAQVIGPVILRRARCRGQIALSRARLNAGLSADSLKVRAEEGAEAIVCESAEIRGDIMIDGGKLSGTLNLANANVRGQLRLRSLEVQAGGVKADGIGVEQGLDLDEARIFGTLNFDGADIAKRISGQGLQLDGGDVAMTARVAKFGGDVSMPDLRAVGEIHLPGCHIRGQLRLTEARLFGSELAIRADGIRVDGGWFMSRATVIGLVRCPAAKLGNQFRMSGATIKVERGIALLATGARFARDVELDDSFNTIGAVVFDQARIQGSLTLVESRIKSAAIARGLSDRTIAKQPQTSGPVVEFEDDAIAGDVVAFSIVDAEIGCLILPERAEQRPRGIVDLSRGRVGSLVDHMAIWPAAQARSVTIDGRDIDHYRLDGFSYGHLANPSGVAARFDGAAYLAGEARRNAASAGRNRISWLNAQHASDVGHNFRPQPWAQLARKLTEQGHHEAARDIAIMQRRLARRASATTASDRWQNRLLDWLALYGYNPWRTVVWMFAVIMLFAAFWASAATLCSAPGCTDETLLVMTAQDRYSDTARARGYPDFNALAYSVDVFFPLVQLGYDDHWRFNAHFGPLFSMSVPSAPALMSLMVGGEPASLLTEVKVTLGSLLYVLVLIERLLGLILASFAVTAFTGLLRPRYN